MGGVVVHPELATDDLGHPRSCPAVAPEAPGRGSLRQKRGHPGLLLRRQARDTTRSRTVAQGGLAFPASAREPLADSAVGHAQGCCNLADRPALLGEFPSTKATPFMPRVRLSYR
jgi:hypothetical protein